MLNLIPALLLFLASGPFGPSSCDARAQFDSEVSRALVAHIAKSLERAAQPVVDQLPATSKLLDKTSKEFPLTSTVNPQNQEFCPPITDGHQRSVRSRDGPDCGA